MTKQSEIESKYQVLLLLMNRADRDAKLERSKKHPKHRTLAKAA